MLTRIEVAQAGKSAKAYKLTDGARLYLEATPSGGKHCRHRFRLRGVQSRFSPGESPLSAWTGGRRPPVPGLPRLAGEPQGTLKRWRHGPNKGRGQVFSIAKAYSCLEAGFAQSVRAH